MVFTITKHAGKMHILIDCLTAVVFKQYVEVKTNEFYLLRTGLYFLS